MIVCLDLRRRGVGEAGRAARRAIIRGMDDQTTFWLWTHHDGGISRFRHIRISDGSTIFATPDVPEYETGIYQGDETLTPLARFGILFSCPLILWRGPADPQVDPSIKACCKSKGKPKCCSHGRTLRPGRTGKLGRAVDDSGSSLTPASSAGRLFPSGADPTTPERWA